MTIFYTSDTHYFHKNIIKYNNRPYQDIDEMNAKLILNWNRIVTPNDTVYHLGDFGFAPKEKLQNILNQLNGIKHFMIGNHDKKATQLNGWSSVQHYKEIRDNGKMIVLAHYCFSVYNKSHHGSINLFGHSHGNHPMNQQQIDVGVDVWDYTPVTLQQILSYAKTLPAFVGKDHHERKK